MIYLSVVRLLYKIFRGDKNTQHKSNVNFCAPYINCTYKGEYTYMYLYAIKTEFQYM